MKNNKLDDNYYLEIERDLEVIRKRKKEMFEARKTILEEAKKPSTALRLEKSKNRRNNKNK